MAHCYCMENNGSFTMVAGECGPIVFHMMDDSGKIPLKINGYQAELTAVDCVNQGTVQISKKPSEITVIDDLIIVKLEPKDTNKLLPGKYLYQLEIWSEDTGPEVVAEGSIFIRKNYRG